MQENILLELKNKYILDPTSQPTAFWKMRNWIKNDLTVIEEGEFFSSIVLNNAMLLRYPISFGFDPSIDNDKIILVFRDEQNLSNKYKEAKYFKLVHNHENINVPKLSKKYGLKNVLQGECNDVVNFINSCYTNISVSEKEVISWRQKSVFDKELWIWIFESASKRKIALGIAEIDSIIGEGALEWIQVNEDNRGNGLGKQLVQELLCRLSEKGEFTTVSGEADNVTKPEQLYRKCGFTGNTIWHIYKKT